jgi:putative IMPACT (imprinted ancient) family translation regulator
VVALTKAEMRAYSERVAQMMAWIARARKRLEQRSELGEIHKLTTEAENALHALRIKSHYSACDHAGSVNERE